MISHEFSVCGRQVGCPPTDGSKAGYEDDERRGMCRVACLPMRTRWQTFAQTRHPIVLQAPAAAEETLRVSESSLPQALVAQSASYSLVC